MKTVRGLRDLKYVFGASVVSNLGDGVVGVALAWAILDLTHSATDLGVVIAFRVVAQVLALLFGGVIADRRSRRQIMMAADLVRLLGQAAMGVLLVTKHATVVELAVSQILLGAAGAFFQPAAAGLLPAVAGENLQEANALQGIAQSASSIIGPLLGALLVVAVGGAWGLLADSASYGLSALLLYRLPRGVGAAPVGEDADSSILSGLRGGFREVASRTWVWTLIGAFALGNSVGATWDVFGPLATRRWYDGAPAYALMSVLASIGAVLAGIALLRFKPRRPLYIGVIVCAPMVTPAVLVALHLPLAIVLPCQLLAGFGPSAFNTLWWTTLQQNVPQAAISRVISYDFAGSFALMPVGMAIAGPVIGGLGLEATMLAFNGFALLVMISTLAIPDVRHLRSGSAEADIVSA